ncbi:MAG: hypothetical protein ABIG31_01645 [Candidatus Omnitrophota bacterium]
MARVNLLKAEIGGVSRALTPKFSLGRAPKFLWMLSGISFLVSLLIVAHTLYQKNNLKFISSEYNEAEKLKKEIGVLYQEKDELNKEGELLAAYLKRDVIWSEKIDQIRRFIPREVWLRKLSLEQRVSRGKEKERFLYLSCALVPKPGTTFIATLSLFMNQFKENQDFLVGFDNPVLSDVKSEKKDNTEIMTFVVEIPLRKAGSRFNENNE